MTNLTRGERRLEKEITELEADQAARWEMLIELAPPEMRDDLRAKLKRASQKYDRQGKVIGFVEFMKHKTDYRYAIVDRHENADVLISTVWLGEDAAGIEPPQIFETAVFDRVCGCDEPTITKHATEAEAKAFHNAVVMKHRP